MLSYSTKDRIREASERGQYVKIGRYTYKCCLNTGEVYRCPTGRENRAYLDPLTGTVSSDWVVIDHLTPRW